MKGNRKGLESIKGKLRADRKKAEGSERGRKKSGIRSGPSKREETEVADEAKTEQKKAKGRAATPAGISHCHRQSITAACKFFTKEAVKVILSLEFQLAFQAQMMKNSNPQARLL